MNARRRTLGATALLATLALALMVGPVAAATPDRATWQDSYTVQHDCDVVESTTVTVSEKAFFEDGDWVRSVLHFTYVSVYAGPTGKTYAATTNQNVTVTPDQASLSGQGTLLRGAGGVLVMDAGRLVLELSGTTIFASANTLSYDDPADLGAVDAALCAKLG
jgi:hypothetical protein